MATLEITLEDEHGHIEETIQVSVPDGPRYESAIMRRCLYCRERFQPQTPHQRFCGMPHQVQWNSEQRPRKTQRRGTRKKGP